MLLVLQQNLLLGEAPDLVPVPDVVGQSQASGTAELEGDGFVVAVVTDYSSTVPAGDIISQSPAAGVERPEGSTVTITVSLGPEPVAESRTPAGGYDIFRKRSRADEERDEDKRRLRELIEAAVTGGPSDVRAAATAVAKADSAVLAEVPAAELDDFMDAAREIALKKSRMELLARRIAAAERLNRIRQDDERLIELLGASGLLQ